MTESPYDKIRNAKRPSQDSPPGTMEEAISSLAAGFLDLLGEDAVLTLLPDELTHDLTLRFPGFREWWQGSSPWQESDLAKAAWRLAYEYVRI